MQGNFKVHLEVTDLDVNVVIRNETLYGTEFVEDHDVESNNTHVWTFSETPAEELRYLHEKARFDKEQAKYEAWKRGETKFSLPKFLDKDDLVAEEIKSDLLANRLAEGKRVADEVNAKAEEFRKFPERYTLTGYEDRPGYIKSDQAPTAGEQFIVDEDNSDKHGNPDAENGE